jgi:hypothetical protein
MEKHSESLWRDIDKHLGHLAASINSEQINSIPQIAVMRSALQSSGQRSCTLSRISGKDCPRSLERAGNLLRQDGNVQDVKTAAII